MNKPDAVEHIASGFAIIRSICPYFVNTSNIKQYINIKLYRYILHVLRKDS